jgi:hypothetical protein
MKTPVVIRNKYILYLENYQGTSFIHCDCIGWTKTIKNSIIQDVDSLVKLHGQPIFAFHNKDDIKHRKFLKLMKFNFYSDIYCPADGEVRQLFVRSN